MNYVMKRSGEILDSFDMAWEGHARPHLAPGAPKEIQGILSISVHHEI